MKKLSDVKNEIKKLESKIFGNDKKGRSERRTTLTRVKFLRNVAMYLETSPDPDFVRKMHSKLELRIDRIKKEAFAAYSDYKLEKERKSYMKKEGLPTCKSQLNIIEFILEDDKIYQTK